MLAAVAAAVSPTSVHSTTPPISTNAARLPNNTANLVMCRLAAAVRREREVVARGRELATTVAGVPVLADVVIAAVLRPCAGPDAITARTATRKARVDRIGLAELAGVGLRGPRVVAAQSAVFCC